MTKIPEPLNILLSQRNCAAYGNRYHMIITLKHSLVLHLRQKLTYC